MPQDTPEGALLQEGQSPAERQHHSYVFLHPCAGSGIGFMTKMGLRWGYKRQLQLAAETVGEGSLCTPQTIYWTASRFMPRIIVTEPEDFPEPL
jgi:hypothetical protein